MATLLTVEQYATLTQRHPNTIRRQLRAGRLGAFKKGRIWLIPATEVDPESLNRHTAISWAIAVSGMSETDSETICRTPTIFPEPRKPAKPLRFMRFVVTQLIGDAQIPQGLFTAAYELMHDGLLTPAEDTELKTLLAWFEDNLPVPDSSQVPEGAVFWYRTAAQACISRMWGLSNLLQSHGYNVAVLSSTWPGHPAFSDKYQVAVYTSVRARK